MEQRVRSMKKKNMSLSPKTFSPLVLGLDEMIPFVNAVAKKVKRPAIVLDIDQTALLNEIVEYSPSPTNPRESVYQLESLKTPIVNQPIYRLYQTAIKRNVDIFFVTARHERHHAETARELRRLGYHTWNGLIMRPIQYRDIAKYKTSARKFIQDRLHYTILLNVGDQHTDLTGGEAMAVVKLVEYPLFDRE